MRLRPDKSKEGGNPKPAKATKQSRKQAAQQTPSTAPTQSQKQPDRSTRTLAKPARNPSRGRRWLYRLIAMTVVPLLLLTTIEIGLRIFGFGYPTAFFIERTGPKGETIATENPEFGRRFFPPGLARHPLPISMPKTKPPGTYRIFVLGESAAMGFPDPTYSFSRILEVLLREAYPDMRFEIVNTAMIAINSHVVRSIANECSEQQPDLFVVHLGNNEVVGPFGTAGVIGSPTKSLRSIRMNLSAKRTRIGQLLDGMVREIGSNEAPKRWQGMAMFQKSHVAADDSRLEATRANFRSNLYKICAAGTDAGAQVLVCTIPVNLSNCAPFASQHRSGMSEQETTEWDTAYGEGIKLEDAGKLSDAILRFEAAATIDAQFADLPFRTARCLLGLGKHAEALQKYRQARNLDTLRFRTDDQFNEIIRGLVGGIRANVHLVDAEADLAAHSPAGIPGEEHFYEHVHLNFSGNYALACSIFHTFAKQVKPLNQATPLSKDRCAEQLAYTAYSQLYSEEILRPLYDSAPFMYQMGNAADCQRRDVHLAELKSELQPDHLTKLELVYENAIRNDPNNWMTRESAAQFLRFAGNIPRALEHIQEVTRQVPHHHTALWMQGDLQRSAGKVAGAVASYEAAIKIYPDFKEAHYDLAVAKASQGKTEEAIALFKRQVNREPDRAEALAEFANFLIHLGRFKEARERVNEALAIDRESPGPNLAMANLLLRDGAVEQAIAHMETAARSNPRLAPELKKAVQESRDPNKKNQTPK